MSSTRLTAAWWSSIVFWAMRLPGSRNENENGCCLRDCACMRSRSGIRPSSRAIRLCVSGVVSCVAVDAARSGFAIALLHAHVIDGRRPLARAAALIDGCCRFGLDRALLVEGLEITDDLRYRRSQLPHYLAHVLRSYPMLPPPTLTSPKSRQKRRHASLLTPAELTKRLGLEWLTD